MQVNKLEITGDKTLIAAAGNPHIRYAVAASCCCRSLSTVCTSMPLIYGPDAQPPLLLQSPAPAAHLPVLYRAVTYHTSFFTISLPACTK